MKKLLTLFLTLLMMFTNGLLAQTDSKSNLSECTTDLKNKLAQFQEGTSFLDFTLGLSLEEKQNFEKLTIHETSSYDNFANLEALKSESSTFLEQLGNSQELSLSVASSIEKVVRDVIQAFGTETAWVTIRSFTPNPAYNLPRWHTDGFYYEPFTGSQYKVAIVFKGAGTLFFHLPTDGGGEFQKLNLQQTVDNFTEIRSELASLIKSYSDQDPSLIYQGAPFSGVVFVVGNPDAAAIHSEPPINTERLFMSIVPGSKEQIQDLKKDGVISNYS